MLFVGLPFLVNGARQAFEGVDPELEQMAYSDGASPWQAFTRVTLPLSWRGISSGAVLMWGRGISEFGAVIILAYNPKIVPVLVYERFTAFGLDAVKPVAVLLVAASLAVFLTLRLLVTRRERPAAARMPATRLRSRAVPTHRTPLHQQIAESLRRRIASGDLAPGDHLPPVRETAEAWGCSPGTAGRAYSQLTREGLVEGFAGGGTRVRPGPLHPREAGLGWASLVNRAEGFLLEAIGEGYSPSQVEAALATAVARWKDLPRETAPASPSRDAGGLRFAGSHDLAFEVLGGMLPPGSSPPSTSWAASAASSPWPGATPTWRAPTCGTRPPTPTTCPSSPAFSRAGGRRSSPWPTAAWGSSPLRGTRRG